MTLLDKGIAFVAMVGFVVMLVSLLKGLMLSSDFQKIETKSTVLGDSTQQTIWIDVEGAVERPGVYQLGPGQRMKDAIVMAGGLSADCNRDWVDKQINMAEIVKDGQKIYIPFLSNTPDGLGYDEPGDVVEMININTASVSDLDTLWGIGESRAEDIVKNRPYMSLEDLLVKKVLTKQILEKNKDKMTVY